MGTYPVLPSYILSSGQNLQEYINQHPELIGDRVINKFGHKDLPFLPKILSINKALTLQVHPVKAVAERLHKEKPKQFIDANHKPEIAVALSDFEAFCGWKPLNEVRELFASLAPVRHYASSAQRADFNFDALCQVVGNILKDTDENLEKAQEGLKKLPSTAFGGATHIPQLLPRLQDQYGPADPGTLVALLTMNYLHLKPGQSCFIPAGGIHAYLSGDIVECMARSNNVLNTGFIPRPDRDDVDVFLETLISEPDRPEDAVLHRQPFPRSSTGRTTVFSPDMDEFDMLHTQIEDRGTETIEALDGPSVLIATKGEGSLWAEDTSYELKEGYVFFVGAGVATTYEAYRGLEVWRAYVE